MLDFRNSYRIVPDKFSGFEAQFRPWFWPFWIECFRTNTRYTIDGAKEVALNHAKGINAIKLGRLP